MPNPTPDQMQAMQGLTPEQRQQAIRGMVEGLDFSAARRAARPRGRPRRLAAAGQRAPGAGRERQGRRGLCPGRRDRRPSDDAAHRLGRGACPPDRAGRRAGARGGGGAGAAGEGRAAATRWRCSISAPQPSPRATSRRPRGAGRRCWRCCPPMRRSAQCLKPRSRKRNNADAARLGGRQRLQERSDRDISRLRLMSGAREPERFRKGKEADAPILRYVGRKIMEAEAHAR